METDSQAFRQRQGVDTMAQMYVYIMYMHTCIMGVRPSVRPSVRLSVRLYVHAEDT